MNKYIAVVITAKDQRPWRGAPDYFPVQCYEFETDEQARTAHPDALVMSIPDYNKWVADIHSNHPAPDFKKPWWKFW